MLMAWILSILALVILVLAGDALVKGAANLSLRLGIPALIVSLTIVAFGTSSPELLITIKAVIEGVPSLALGNVVGSNTANVLLVLGLPALLATMHTTGCDTRKTFLMMMGASVLFVAMGLTGVYTWVSGLVLLSVLAVFLAVMARDAMAHKDACAAGDLTEDVEGADPDMAWWKVIAYLIAGLVGLPIGADLLIDNASQIALAYGLSEAVIGLTMVAVGTSLPELATTVMAALRKQADVAMGNVIGSNMFNLLAIIGVGALVGEIPVDPEFLRLDFWVMLGASALLIPFVFLKRDITRGWGIALCALYIAYVWVLVA